MLVLVDWLAHWFAFRVSVPLSLLQICVLTFTGLLKRFEFVILKAVAEQLRELIVKFFLFDLEVGLWWLSALAWLILFHFLTDWLLFIFRVSVG